MQTLEKFKHNSLEANSNSWSEHKKYELLEPNISGYKTLLKVLYLINANPHGENSKPRGMSANPT